VTEMQRQWERRCAQTDRAVQVTCGYGRRHHDSATGTRSGGNRGVPPVQPTRPGEHNRAHPRPGGVPPFPDGISRHRNQPAGALPYLPLQADGANRAR